MRFKTFRISKIDGDYEKLYYHDKKFYKKYVTTDDWWDLEFLPTEHDYYDFQLFINMLTAYSEEHNNPLAVQFEIIVKPFKLKEPAFGHTHEDVVRPQH